MPGVAYLSSRGQSLYFKNSLKKILLHQIPALSFRRDQSQFTAVEKTNQCVMGGWGRGVGRKGISFLPFFPLPFTHECIHLSTCSSICVSIHESGLLPTCLRIVHQHL